MEIYKALQEIKGEIKKDVIEEITPQLQQMKDATHNSVSLTERKIIGEVKEFREEMKSSVDIQRRDQIIFLDDLKNMVEQFKSDNESRLDSFEKRLIHVESGMLSKWHLLAIYIIVIMAMGLSIFITTREFSLEQRDTQIENLFKKYFPNETVK